MQYDPIKSTKLINYKKNALNVLKIDKIDMMILSELSNDASVSIPKISKK